jgi:hypothetical protein
MPTILIEETRLTKMREAHGAAIIAQAEAVARMEAAERKLRVCLRALDLLRRDSKSPDFVKVYCALIEDEISLGGGGAERQGDVLPATEATDNDQLTHKSGEEGVR